ncbi:MAG: cytochrome c3 family protein [Candidatus Eiseniibacteriota bacterium]
MAKKKKAADTPKGTFGNARLPVSERYVYPLTRNRLLAAALVGAGIVVAILATGFVLRGDRVFSTGPLSSSHATYEDDCSACHSGVAPITASSVVDEKCESCHEKHGDRLGVYSFDTHYIYRSADFRRAGTRDGELGCRECHTEHEGRDAALIRPVDEQCSGCHFESFDHDHPEFDFVGMPDADDANLRFTHTNHVRRLLKRFGIQDNEQACLYCHNAQPDGAGFRPLDFELHCSACHLNGGTTTELLPVGRPTAENKTPGVLTLETLRREPGPSRLAASLSDPSEFQERSGEVRKINVHHRDPWIIANLRELRRVQYPDADLVDLLSASSDVRPGETHVLFDEAVRTLRDRVQTLRAQPQREVQRDLNEIEKQLASVERRLRNPYTVLDDSGFVLDPGEMNPDFTSEDVARFDEFVNSLTASCQMCHVVRNSTIARVQKDQRSLRRAHFNHRAHILQLRCLDCHAAIPIAENVGQDVEVDVAKDNASILNLPRIGTCHSCHAAEKADSGCATCHFFHPNKTQRSNLLLTLE